MKHSERSMATRVTTSLQISRRRLTHLSRVSLQISTHVAGSRNAWTESANGFRVLDKVSTRLRRVPDQIQESRDKSYDRRR